MTALSDGQLAALQNLSSKKLGVAVDWIGIAAARSLTELGLARRTQEGWAITPAGRTALNARSAASADPQREGADELATALAEGGPSILESELFRQFIDHLPVAVAVSELRPSERIVYANQAFAELTGRSAEGLTGEAWDRVPGAALAPGKARSLGTALVEEQDYVGVFGLDRDGGPVRLDAWSNLIEDEHGEPLFRLVALAEARRCEDTEADRLAAALQEKDTLLRELQHRVKNNLQMITALIRIEARGVVAGNPDERLSRLAGRVEALALLYRSLDDAEPSLGVDLGAYLGQIATAVMAAHAREGVRLDLKIDAWPVSIDVAMPAGLVVNELLTNALKHAFQGRDGGTISLQSLVNEQGCRVVVSDDGVGLPEGVEWPGTGRLSALIAESLRRNAKADIRVRSDRGRGVSVTIFFAKADAAPPAAEMQASKGA
jgi:PAS domain S-box-containing protein